MHFFSRQMRNLSKGLIVAASFPMTESSKCGFRKIDGPVQPGDLIAFERIHGGMGVRQVGKTLVFVDNKDIEAGCAFRVQIFVPGDGGWRNSL